MKENLVSYKKFKAQFLMIRIFQEVFTVYLVSMKNNRTKFL